MSRINVTFEVGQDRVVVRQLFSFSIPKLHRLGFISTELFHAFFGANLIFANFKESLCKAIMIVTKSQEALNFQEPFGQFQSLMSWTRFGCGLMPSPQWGVSKIEPHPSGDDTWTA